MFIFRHWCLINKESDDETLLCLLGKINLIINVSIWTFWIFLGIFASQAWTWNHHASIFFFFEILQIKKVSCQRCMKHSSHRSHFQTNSYLLVTTVNLHDQLEPDMNSVWGNHLPTSKNFWLCGFVLKIIDFPHKNVPN